MPRNVGIKTGMVRRSKGSSGHRNKNRLSGLALMELILAVAIISLLIGFASRNGQRLFDFCYRIIDKMSLATLVAEYNTVERDVDLSGVTDMKSFAVALAKAGGPKDIASYQSIKRRNKKHIDILVGGQRNAALRNTDFDFIAVEPNNDPEARDILFCICGLDDAGSWSRENSLYGHEGGLIAFRDGRTKWVSKCPQAGTRLVQWWD